MNVIWKSVYGFQINFGNPEVNLTDHAAGRPASATRPADDVWPVLQCIQNPPQRWKRKAAACLLLTLNQKRKLHGFGEE